MSIKFAVRQIIRGKDTITVDILHADNEIHSLPDQVVKVGDTIADIKEGVNAKVWSVGIVTGSNEMGVSEEEYNSRPAEEWESLKKEVRERMLAAGAHFVLDTIAELPACIEKINNRDQA